MHREDANRHALGAKSLDEAEQVDDVPCQSLRLRDDEDIAGSHPVERGLKFRSCRVGAADLFGEDARAAGSNVARFRIESLSR